MSFDNTLEASLMTGAQVRAYLEYSAKYFVQTAADAVVDAAKLTNAAGRPDYNYDSVSGSVVRHRYRAGGGFADQEPDVRGCGVGRTPSSSCSR